MTDLNDLYDEFDPDIQDAVDSLTMRMRLSAADLKAAFEPEEIQRLDETLAAVRAATDDNNRAAIFASQADLFINLLRAHGVVL